MAKQAKCKKCKVRYTWDRELALRRCYCPKCGEQLTGTTYLSQLPIRALGPLKPLGKTHICYHKNGQASLYCLENNQYRACYWEQHQKKDSEKSLTELGKDDSIK